MQSFADHKQDLCCSWNVLFGNFEVDCFFPADSTIEDFGGGGDRGTEGFLSMVKGGFNNSSTGRSVGENWKIFNFLHFQTVYVCVINVEGMSGCGFTHVNSSSLSQEESAWTSESWRDVLVMSV